VEAVPGSSLLSWNICRFAESVQTFHSRVPTSDDFVRSVWVNAAPAVGLALGSTQSLSVVQPVAGLDIVRRRSGGGAVLVVPDEMVWIDVLISASDRLWSDDVGRSFEWLGSCWASVLGDAAVVHRGALVTSAWSRLVCFAGLGPGEVVVGGRKVVGISQRRTRSGARFQCAAHVVFDPARLPGLLALQPAERVELTAHLAAAVGVVAGSVDDVVARFVATLPA
jgi:lipoate---protein ligase